MLSLNATRLQQTHLHDFDKWDDAVHVFTCSYQPLQYQYLVIFEHVTADSSHHLYSRQPSAPTAATPARTDINVCPHSITTMITNTVEDLCKKIHK